MAFRPKSGEHAIVEVVFGIQLSRPWQPHEIEKLVNAHDRWREGLPRLARHQVHQVFIGDGPPPTLPAPPTGGVSFERIKPDGDLAWRLRCEDRSISVNCLDYTRWREVWEEAHGYIRAVCDVAVAKDNAVHGIVLQYIDIFEHEGDPDSYDIAELIREGSDYVPRSIWNKGPFWHLHQGWFRHDELPAPGRLLEKIHLDALTDDAQNPLVKMDTLLRLDFAADRPVTKLIGDEGDAQELFDNLHDINKDIMRRYLTDDVLQRIGLDD